MSFQPVSRDNPRCIVALAKVDSWKTEDPIASLRYTKLVITPGAFGNPLLLTADLRGEKIQPFITVNHLSGLEAPL